MARLAGLRAGVRRRRAGALPARAPRAPNAARGRRAAVQRRDALRQHDPDGQRAAVPRRPRPGAAHLVAHPLERDGDGAPGQQGVLASWAATSRATSPRRRCTRSASTTSGARRARTTGATSSSCRATRRRASTRARSSRAASPRSSCAASARRSTTRALDGGLSSYPHPWLMPDYWQFPTVSMGLGPLMAIYQARFMKYLQGRDVADTARSQGVGLPRRRRDRRAGVARRDLAGRARAPRQPHLRRQLQPAAPRRAGARQRQDHPGARDATSAARAGTSSRSSGAAAGTRSSRPTPTGHAARADGGGRRRRLPDLQVARRRVRARALLRRATPSCARWSRT